MLERSGTPLLIVGASARAAARSARWRGRKVLALDLFADRDLRRLAEDFRQIPAALYPDGIPHLARDLADAPFLITGGLENHPRVVRALEATRSSEGTPASALESARDPFLLARILEGAGIPRPRVSRHPPAASTGEGRRWLRKPRRGSGGAGISLVRPQSAPSPAHYFQERIAGLPCSAVYEASRAGSCQLLGATRQLVGEAGLGAAPLAYCGSVGPLDAPDPVLNRLARIGEVVTRELGLRGLFGVDAILAGDIPWPVEVNPRYTASTEIVEALARGQGSGAYLGKAIVFARQTVVIPGDSDAWLAGGAVADVPVAGTRIEAGHPVLTVFASGATPARCRRNLLTRARFIHGQLGARDPEQTLTGNRP